ncbi:MAG: hypothetical protein DMD35_00265 [Gemmatimonadetes bacterium]|nr:MAG: hypothetical protein DMD35_00265 [Gemmatimonadota bacterium]
MPPHTRLSLALSVFALLAACGSDGPAGPAGGDFSLGQSLATESGRDVRVVGGSTGGSYVAVVVNLALDSVGKASYSLRASGFEAGQQGPFGYKAPLAVRVPGVEDDRFAPRAPARDEAFESRLRDRERTELTPRFASARQANAISIPALPATVAVGDLFTINVNATDPCTNPVYHPARVVAIGTKALILNDTLNPKPGFATADYQRFAARFDTLVYPMDAAAFGEPTDIDKNGHIAIVFTRAVNELTARSASTYVGGLTFSRDLFPQAGSARAQACAASNEGEFFYLMAPDPNGTINGNRRSNAFVDSSSTGVIAHELVHLINSSRKLYVNTAAPKFEDKWLDEGLAHIAEELLFYREAGLSPRTNITYQTLVSSVRVRNAFLNDMSGNQGRYRDFLSAPPDGSPYRVGDDLSTRGAAWSLLRYLADRARSSDGDVWSRLVNNTSVGIANLQSVFGDVAPLVRDWSVSNMLDDAPSASAELSQKSWNWHSIFGGIDGLSALYPLPANAMSPATPTYTGTVVPGGSAYYKFTVPASGTATLTLDGQSGAPGSNLQLVIVRTK